MNPPAREKLVLIDGNSLVYRAFYAVPPLQSSSGEHTNAVFGFCNMLFKLLDTEKPDYLAVAFDPPAPTFRHDIYPEYKSQREKTPAELGEQMGRVKEILEAMHIPRLEVEGFEADDVIGTLAVQAAKRSLDTLIVTGDADLLQLISPHIRVLLTRRGISRMDRYDRERLRERYGLEPEQFADFKALKGDPSDNIPGLPGVGEKTARKILSEYGSLERLLASVSSPAPGLAGRIEEYREQLIKGRELVALRLDVPLEIDWEALRLGAPDTTRLQALFEQLEFLSLQNKLQELLAEHLVQPAVELQGEPVGSAARWFELLNQIEPGSTVAFLVEEQPGRLNWQKPPLLAALAVDPRRCYYLEPRLLQDRAFRQALIRVWDRGVVMVGHDIKFLIKYFLHHDGIAPPFIFDSKLACYLLEPTRPRYDLGFLLVDYLDLPSLSDELPAELRGKKLATCARHLFALKEKLEEGLQKQLLNELYFDLELPLAAVLARMEMHGIKVELSVLNDMAGEVRSSIQRLEEEIFSLAGEPFNLNSPRQLSRILFEKLKLPPVRRTKTGQSTDARVLEELAPRHEIVARILHYRQLIKLESTYLTALQEQVVPETSRIYTTFNQTVTATGRLSSSEPNLQNIPVRLEEGRRIRQAFVPSRKNQVLLAADYSQIELRILAHLSKDPILLEAFNSEQDIHRRTAAEVFHVSPDEVTPEMREKAKAVNFGIIYGISDYGLGQGLNVSRQEAQKYIDSYFQRYRGVRRYVEAVIEKARESGYVTTLLNRRRSLPELHSKHFGRRSFAERIARNTPVQGTAADIIKLAMLRIDKLIREGGFSARILLQVHDDLLFEMDRDELEFFAPLVKREMESAYALSVPLRVVLKWGPNWADLLPLEIS